MKQKGNRATTGRKAPAQEHIKPRVYAYFRVATKEQLDGHTTSKRKEQTWQEK